MPLTHRPLDADRPAFAGLIEGVDLTRPFDADLAESVMSAMDRYAVCVIRGQQAATDAQHVAFSRLFGELETAPRYGLKDGRTSRMALPELFEVSNLDEDGRIAAADHRKRLYHDANQLWHTDSSFQPHGASYSLLRAKVVPAQGGQTEFLDMRGAYEALPEATKQRIAGLVAEHSTAHSRSLVGYVFDEREKTLRHPTLQYLVQPHPRTGRPALYLASHASHIVGWPLEEGRALLAELTAHAVASAPFYRHAWQVGDILIWDNRCTMHRATPFAGFEEPRDLCRTTVVGDLPLVPAPLAA